MARSAAIYLLALVMAAAVLVLVLAPMQAQASLIYTEEDLASDASMWALYERWAAHHKVVREHGDKVRRFPVFKNNARGIYNKYGKKNNGKSSVNIFADMTYEELVITLATGLRESDQDSVQYYSRTLPPDNF